MRHIFIVNPIAGKQRAKTELIPLIEKAVDKKGIDAEIYITSGVGDCENYVRACCESDEPMRFYACGGDGTVGEATNGIYGSINKELAVIPIGTGNDFVRNFTHQELFTNIENQIDGKAEVLDLICCKTATRTIHAINMINIGFDCDVAAKIQDLKRLPLISGSLAYYLGVVITLLSKMGKEFATRINDETEIRGKYLLVSAGNGCYCGGGFCASPNGDMQDGLLDVLMVKKVSRRQFISLVGKYKNGTHTQPENAKDIITYHHLPSVTIEPLCSMKVCVDGEIFDMEKMELSIVRNAVSFSVPAGCEIIVRNKVPQMA